MARKFSAWERLASPIFESYLVNIDGEPLPTDKSSAEYLEQVKELVVDKLEFITYTSKYNRQQLSSEYNIPNFAIFTKQPELTREVIEKRLDMSRNRSFSQSFADELKIEQDQESLIHMVKSDEAETKPNVSASYSAKNTPKWIESTDDSNNFWALLTYINDLRRAKKLGIYASDAYLINASLTISNKSYH